MKELVGHCDSCQKPIYCLDGFFNGVKKGSGEIVCFDCHEEEENNDGS
ncbi:hypothetical protein [Bacillus sp. Marseille-Q1617]|nr:hypothetical protein [Bacillus sp. Marseille-Q1617]